MDGDIAKRIFTKFLKEKKLMGLATVYYFGKPNYGYVNIESNSKVLNDSARLADENYDKNYTKKRLIDMVGRTREPNIMLKKFVHDYLYDIYVLWKEYVEKNWGKIYNEYYKDKRSPT